MLINENDEYLIWSGVEEQQLTCSSSPLSPQLEQNLIQSPFNTGQILMSASTPASADTSIQQNKENTTTAITGTILLSKRLEGSDDDVIAYKRNCERLVSEFSRKSANDSLMVQLITKTFPLHRKDIENSLQRTSELLKLYPFFLSEKWVSLDRYLICIMH